jgi:hypothetical protein
MLKKAAILTSAAAAATFALAPLAHASDDPSDGAFSNNNVNVDTNVECENGNAPVTTSPLGQLVGTIGGALGSATYGGDHQNQTLSPYVNKCGNQKSD